MLLSQQHFRGIKMQALEDLQRVDIEQVKHAMRLWQQHGHIAATKTNCSSRGITNATAACALRPSVDMHALERAHKQQHRNFSIKI
jgi:hypothetical protein